MGPTADPAAWGMCRVCGTAVAPRATACGLCGADRPVAAALLRSAPVSVRRRIALSSRLRAVLVVGVAVALAYTLIDAALSGPPNVIDPLTTSGVYTVAPGSKAILAGNVTGGDYVVGNFTTIDPYGADVTFSAYNSTEWATLVETGAGTPVWSTPAEGSGRLIFSAEYTDTYTFVVTNPYPASSDRNITVYVATEYESNVGDDGFG